MTKVEKIKMLANMLVDTKCETYDNRGTISFMNEEHSFYVVLKFEVESFYADVRRKLMEVNGQLEDDYDEFYESVRDRLNVLLLLDLEK